VLGNLLTSIKTVPIHNLDETIIYVVAPGVSPGRPRRGRKTGAVRKPHHERKGCAHPPAASERNIFSVTSMHSSVGNNEAIFSLLTNKGFMLF